MEQIQFFDVEAQETVQLYVVEQTVIGGVKYLLVTEDDAEEADAYIFKVVSEDDEESTYEPVEDEEEYTAIAKVFEELLDEDTELRR